MKAAKYEFYRGICLVAGIDLTSPRLIFRDDSVRLISCWKTPQNAGNSLSELQEIQNFLGGMPPDPSRGSHLQWSTRLSQNPNYGLICCPMTYTAVYLLVKPCVYMLQVAGCSDTNLPTGTFPGPPLNMSPPVIHP